MNELDLVNLCKIAERAARSKILEKVSRKDLIDLNTTIEIVSENPLTVNVEVEVTLSPSVKGIDVNFLTKEATNEALKAIEHKVKEVKH